MKIFTSRKLLYVEQLSFCTVVLRLLLAFKVFILYEIMPVTASSPHSLDLEDHTSPALSAIGNLREIVAKANAGFD